ncbi:MAG: hypothetical protein H0X39_17900, partial [Actinobacteria bacterium]|nr:hypothetical protein [Actinomycetota bacterium]
MNVVALTVATAGAGLGGALAARLLELSDPLDRVIAAILLACTQVLVTSLAVGAVLDHYDRRWLVVGTLLGDAALLAVFALRPGIPLDANARVIPASVSAVRALALWQRLLLAAALAATLWRAFLAVLLPPFAYDALSYHLTAVASWVQRGSIGTNPYAFCCERYPSDAEVLFAWPTVLLGRDTLTDAVQIVFAVLGSLAVIGIARAAGLTKAGSLTAGALFALTPIVLAQSNTDYNDVAITGVFLTGLYFSARFLTARGFAFSRGAHHAELSHALLAGIAA